MDNKTLGFIILRHVNNEKTNLYWNHSYDCVRKYYPENQIIIIDDNSNYEFITERELYKTTIIKSEYPQRGELLPYYYYLKNKLFEHAVIIHDSVFINKYIDFTIENEYKILWDFQHIWDQIDDETCMILEFNDADLYKFYNNKELWKGCFGGMSFISHDYLEKINKKYDISLLLKKVRNRFNRQSFERVIAVLLEYECVLKYGDRKESMFGELHKYCDWAIRFEDKDCEFCKKLPIIKVWTGR